MSRKFLAKAHKISEERKVQTFNVLKCGATSGENCYDGEKSQLTSAMEMMYYLSLCRVYSGEMEH